MDSNLSVGDWIVLDGGEVAEVVSIGDGLVVVARDRVVPGAVPGAVPDAVPQPRPRGPIVTYGWAAEGVPVTAPLSLPQPISWVASIAEAMRRARENPGTPVTFDLPDDGSVGQQPGI